jgi:hypothetical protein
MIRSEVFEEWYKTYVSVNKLMDVIIYHIQKENCQHWREYLREGMEARNE